MQCALRTRLKAAITDMNCANSSHATGSYRKILAIAGMALAATLLTGCAHDQAAEKSRPEPMKPTRERTATVQPLPALRANTTQGAVLRIARHHLIRPRAPNCGVGNPDLSKRSPGTPSPPSNPEAKPLEVLVLGLERDCYARAEKDVRYRLIKLQSAIPKP